MSNNQLDNIPPQNLEAEMSFLGSILIDKDALIKVADRLIPDDFYKTAHAKIYENILDLYGNNEPIDLLTLSSKLEDKKLLDKVGGKSYLASLASNVPTSSNVLQYAKIIQRKSTRRRLLIAAQEITRLGFKENGELDEVLEEAQHHLFGVSQNHFKQTFTPIRGVLADAFDRIDELHKNKGQMRGLASGITQLDNILTGFQKSDLVIVAARPSVGKTSLALDFVRNAGVRLKIPVGLFSLEMGKEQLVDRLLCAEANIDLWRLRSGRLSDRPEDDDFPRIGHAIGTLSEAPIFIDDSPNINILQLRTKARRLKAEHGLGMIVIDYLQLMDSRGSESRVQEVSEITRGLKGIARELDIPVIALSQLSRVVEQSKPAIPKLSHLRESGSIEQDADVVMFIYRKSADRNYQIEDVPPDERHIGEIHIAKHRNGPTGVVKVFFNAACTSFRNLDSRISELPSGNSAPPAPETPKLRPRSDFNKKPSENKVPPM